jgi:hypothetical protein
VLHDAARGGAQPGARCPTGRERLQAGRKLRVRPDTEGTCGAGCRAERPDGAGRLHDRRAVLHGAALHMRDVRQLLRRRVPERAVRDVPRGLFLRLQRRLRASGRRRGLRQDQAVVRRERRKGTHCVRAFGGVGGSEREEGAEGGRATGFSFRVLRRRAAI